MIVVVEGGAAVVTRSGAMVTPIVHRSDETGFVVGVGYTVTDDDGVRDAIGVEVVGLGFDDAERLELAEVCAATWMSALAKVSADEAAGAPRRALIAAGEDIYEDAFYVELGYSALGELDRWRVLAAEATPYAAFYRSIANVVERRLNEVRAAMFGEANSKVPAGRRRRFLKGR